MVLLTIYRPDPDRWSDMLDRAVAVDSTGEEVVLRCYIDGEYAYCLDDPTWVAALVTIGVPVTIQDYDLDAVIETDWQDVERDGKATVREMVEYAYGHLLGWTDGYRPFRGESYYISDMPEDNHLHCINYSDVLDIAFSRAQATVEDEEDQED
jgi:hypothetical protein